MLFVCVSSDNLENKKSPLRRTFFFIKYLETIPLNVA